ncbi:MAG: AraC family transcriptional regulator [Gammaproteobacteria bacterium]|nr:AraC family transcriptional regulator [Gammaproteobacteria bacterium]
MFNDIGHVQQVSQQMGANMEYRQLEPGALQSFASHQIFPDVSVGYDGANRRIEVMGDNAGYVFFILPTCETTFWINGRTVSDGECALLTEGADLHAMDRTTPGKFLTVLVRIPLLSSALSAVSGDAMSLGSGLTLTARPKRHRIQRLKQLVLCTLDSSTDQVFIDQLVENLVFEIAVTFANDQATSNPHAHETRGNGLRTIRLAKDYIEAHLTAPMRITDVSTYAGVSLSKLERVFRRELMTSPAHYIRAHRLAAVRRTLTDEGVGGKQITKSAVEYGFTHLGRFSAAYRDQFGHLPSEEKVR